MSRKRQNYMKRSDALFSKLIRERDGMCVANGVIVDTTVYLGCNGNLQCAHIHSRSYKSIRTDFKNAIALCAKHHVYFTHRPLEWQEFVESQWPGVWDELKAKALEYGNVDWKARHAELKRMVDSVEVT